MIYGDDNIHEGLEKLALATPILGALGGYNAAEDKTKGALTGALGGTAGGFLGGVAGAAPGVLAMKGQLKKAIESGNQREIIRVAGKMRAAGLLGGLALGLPASYYAGKMTGKKFGKKKKMEKKAMAMSAKEKAKAVVMSDKVGVNDAMKSAKTPEEKRAILKALREKKMQKTASKRHVAMGTATDAIAAMRGGARKTKKERVARIKELKSRPRGDNRNRAYGYLYDTQGTDRARAGIGFEDTMERTFGAKLKK